jgi:hypothetical protein
MKYSFKVLYNCGILPFPSYDCDKILSCCDGCEECFTFILWFIYSGIIFCTYIYFNLQKFMVLLLGTFLHVNIFLSFLYIYKTINIEGLSFSIPLFLKEHQATYFKL